MSWIEERLNELAAEGYFDDLPGSGRPIADLERHRLRCLRKSTASVAWVTELAGSHA